MGPATVTKSASLAEVLATVPRSRVPEAAFLSFDAEDWLRHARGQSFGDWVALRSGKLGVFPDAVAYPETSDDVRSLLEWAQRTGTRLIPYGGGTSVAGHVNPEAIGGPTVTMDLGRMSSLLKLDAVSRLATFGAGVSGPDLEAQPARARPHAGALPAVLRAVDARRLDRHALAADSSRCTTAASSGSSPAAGWRRPRARSSCPSSPPRPPGPT